MSSIPSGKSGMGGGKSPFSERLAGMFREAGKEEKRIVFLCMWVTRFGKFIAPKRYHDAGSAEVEAFFEQILWQGHPAHASQSSKTWARCPCHGCQSKKRLGNDVFY